MANSFSVSDHIITQAEKIGKPVSNLKLQKIMYFLNVIYLLNYNKSLIDDHKFEKWAYGPVIHDVYSDYSINGSKEILEPTKHIKSRSFNDGKYKNKYYSENELKLGLDDSQFIDNNLEKFVSLNPFFLVEKSHEEPQWKDKTKPYYDDKKTILFYKDPKNKFWEHD
ncbi:DUF4065 domain-containing protein [Fructilactobacillus hinvesii]|uniref:DUF4065 domain-containing protein n=1 Tax=Fructilactobacillus hinvesii TaxID=2940300 RepID=A0ABY5BT06_9LACO|nr:type II toxin-antitoxin system antitoxin SocA domain-containing protein [Fructilactobacillus hinvesii]USS88227.1 DUF4065 domain-containing protein [Fructilactobacillus hinvesii]